MQIVPFGRACNARLHQTSNLVELSTKSFKDGRNCGFHLPLRKLSIMSSVAHLAAEPSS